ncbi:MAG: class I tRNA ligase family protein [Candidatus Micrarchaeota archaeon]|nr:class I tRNA ligase family protein [Candidatus Micrarchaeota archaeon]
MHVRHLIVEGKKMSKSKGNVVLLPDLLARGFSAREVRMLLLSVHYRKRMDFAWQHAKDVKLRSLGIRKAIATLKAAHGEARDGFDTFAADAKREFEACMDDDMDSPCALDVAGKFARECAGAHLSKRQVRDALLLLRKFDTVLACLPL